MNRLVLIDGNAVLHRAFHAIPPLTTKDGTVVNAVYGFTAMLLRIVHDLAPTHMAVAFDRPKPTFRKKLFEGYQAKRPKMDDTLVPQVGMIHEMVEAFHIPIFEMDGFEADDIIGTLCRKAQMTNEKGQNKSKVQNLNAHVDQTIIVTGDRDILQLVVDEKVLVYMPTKGLSEAKLYGEKEVVERMGVVPKQVADLKALSGDNSDNYPGVAGIGPKTAVSLIETFGSTEELYEALKKKDKKLEKFSAGVIGKLEAGAKDAVLFKEVASIRTDVPLDGSIDECVLPTLNTEDARNMLMQYEFTTLLKRLTGDKGPASTAKRGEQETGVKEKASKQKETQEEKKDDSEQQQLF